MAENPLHLSPVYILLRAAVSEGFDPCETLRDLISHNETSTDPYAQSRKIEAEKLLAEFCKDSAKDENV